MASSGDSSVPCAEHEKKSSWPELVGKSGDFAAATIKRENPKLNVIVLPEGSPTTRDYRTDRVWVFVDHKGNVAVTPKIG